MAADTEILERLIVRIGYEVEPEGQKKLEGERQASATKAVAIGNLISAGVQKAAALAMDAVQALVGALVDAVKGFADTGSEIADTSKKLGIGTTELQRLRYAAKQSGVEMGSLDGAIGKFQKGLSEARAKGTGPLVDGLGQIGVRLEELDGLSPEQQFGLLGDAIAGIKEPSDRTAAAMALFGKSGADLLPFLMEGQAGIGALTKRADELGIVMSESAVGAADALGDTLDDLDAVIGAAAGRVAGALAPAITDMVGKTTEWIAENDTFIEQDLPAVIESIVSAGAFLLTWLVDVVVEFRNFGKLVRDTSDDVVAFVGTLTDDLEPAISAVTTVAEAWADAFATVNEGIGDGIAKVLDYVGVLDTLKAAWEALPFTGESIDELTARLHGGGLVDSVQRFTGARGPVQGGRDADGNPISVSGRATGGRAAGAGRAGAAIAAALEDTSKRIVEDIQAANRAAMGGGSSSRAAARERYLRQQRNKGKGGGGSADGPSGKETLGKLWEGLTGQHEPTFLDRVGSALGIGGDAPRGTMSGGGGGSPLSGAVFNRIDASFSQTNHFAIELPPGLQNAAGANLAASVAGAVVDKLDDVNRPVFAHYQQVLRTI
jgi:hypothetical protein